MRFSAAFTANAVLAAGAFAAAALLAAGAGASARPASTVKQSPVRLITATIDTRAGRDFVPALALGAGVDGHEQGEIAKLYTPANLAAMKSVGLASLTYRLRTELGIEAWHWNPRGSWSEPGKNQGYWTSAASSKDAIEQCNGYRLPRRGSSVDQANNDGYSRIDDGDENSFWKSNPYLDSHFTGEPNAQHPQWIVIDLGARRPLDRIRIDWGAPFATAYHVDYWGGLDDVTDGAWHAFSGGSVQHGRGGRCWLKLTSIPVRARFVRVVMTASSGRALSGRSPSGSRDIRDGLGYAIREIGLGLGRGGHFHDEIRHSKSSGTQTCIFASSTDPWHSASDLDRNTEQPGFDRVFHSGLDNGQPVLVPVGVLYDTPANAVAELRFLRARGYNIKGVELGEEPDGQCVSPDDYAALYIQFCNALHAYDPRLVLGGPSFQTVYLDYSAFPMDSTPQTWLTRFLLDLKARGHLNDFRFCSFEWYPFDNVHAPTPPQVQRASALLTRIMARMRRSLDAGGARPDLPILVTECGYSAFAGRAEVDIAGALFDADAIARFLQNGGSTIYLYGYELGSLMSEPDCPPQSDACWGNNMMLLGDDDGHVRYRTPTYYAAWLVTHAWLAPAGQKHRLYPVDTGDPVVSAYAVRQPDQRWSVLFINKDPLHARRARITFAEISGQPKMALRGPLEAYTYSPQQYVWHADRGSGHPSRDLPPARCQVPSGSSVSLPAYSLCVVSGSVAY